jgi:hypothetical protein
MHLFACLSEAFSHQAGVITDTTGLRRILGRDDMALHVKPFARWPGGGNYFGKHYDRAL